MHRIGEMVDDLIVVEGFTETWWLHQWSYPATVPYEIITAATEQARLVVSLVKPHGRVWVMADGNEAGDAYASTALV